MRMAQRIGTTTCAPLSFTLWRMRPCPFWLSSDCCLPAHLAGCGWTRLPALSGACVIASWSYGLIRDTGAILLDMNPDKRMAEKVRQTIEGDGDRIADLHLWRLGPGHLGAIVSVVTGKRVGLITTAARLAVFPSLSHLTIEVQNGA